MLHRLCLLGLLLSVVFAQESPDLSQDGEVHLRNIRQLTFGGENAEAYFSFDGTKLIFQSTRDALQCDQIFTMGLDGSGVRMVSTGKGKTTCSYFLPGDDRIVYASTHLAGPECPPRPDYSEGYVWPLDRYDIFVANADGSGTELLFGRPGYDAEATVSPRGDRIVFTSDMDGDLEIYSMAIDGSDVQRLTDREGYDGGPFFSPDGSMICYRAQELRDDDETDHYRDLLARNLVEPARLDIWVMDADGSNKRKLTDNNAANFCPFFHPSGEKLLFASNLADPRGRNFDLFMVDLEGGEPERVTFSPDFDGFPMFSPDGTQLVFASNRNAQERGETNVFIAEWVENP